MTTLTEFLRARLDEEYAAAKAAYDEASDYQVVGSELAEEHFVGWKPDKVMADIDAKRKIIDTRAQLEAKMQAEDPLGMHDDGGQLYTLDWVIFQHATTYADHEDFDPDWRP